MKKYLCFKHIVQIWTGILCLSLSGKAFGQAIPIRLNNPDFEGIPAAANPPSGWLDCGLPGETPPDTQPLIASYSDTVWTSPPTPGKNIPRKFKVVKRDTGLLFNVRTLPYSGKSYLGMVVRENGSYEAISQFLASALIKDQCYFFNVFCARSDSYLSSAISRKGEMKVAEFTSPCVLRVWGGNSPCERGELLGKTGNIINTRWNRYQFKLAPKNNNYRYLILEVYYQTPTLFEYNGNVLLDKASDIIPVPCDEKLPEPNEEIVVTKKPPVKPNPPTIPATGNVSIPKIAGMDRNQMKTGTTIRIDKIYFKADSSEMSSTSFTAVDEIVSFLQQNPDIVIEVGGHTNNIPKDLYCDSLSSSRARNVANYIVKKGILPSRVKYKGYGKRVPVETNSTSEGRKRNQRVEVKILSMKSN